MKALLLASTQCWCKQGGYNNLTYMLNIYTSPTLVYIAIRHYTNIYTRSVPLLLKRNYSFNVPTFLTFFIKKKTKRKDLTQIGERTEEAEKALLISSSLWLHFPKRTLCSPITHKHCRIHETLSTISITPKASERHKTKAKQKQKNRLNLGSGISCLRAIVEVNTS